MSNVAFELSNVRESFLMAMTAIKTNKLRSALTLVGIIVGVFSIIAVMTAMGVLRNSIEEGMSQLGANTFQIQKFPSGFNSGPEMRRKLRNRKDITYEQALQVRDKTTLAEAVGLEVWQFGVVAVYKDKKTNPNLSIAGENVDGVLTNNWIVEFGRSINQDDVNKSNQVVVLGNAVVEKIFPHSMNPIGEFVRIDGVIYQVVGIFEKKKSTFDDGQDNLAVIPITSYFEKYGKRARSVNIMVKAKSALVYEDCLEQSRAILRVARAVPPGADDDFSYFSNEAIIEQFNDITSTFRLGVFGISSIALLAAGIGIMNIMLVSVTERTREIGIRKAIGARRSNILTQFILEAVVLSEMGGVIGIAVGILAGNSLAFIWDFPVVIPYDWAIIGFVICSIIGVVFGVYPAWKASNLDPIESLRYE
jgi:putative ABC transport system permease protein